MKKIIVLFLTLVLCMSLSSVCYAVDSSSEENETFDIFSGDVEIPAFPSGFGHLPYRVMCYSVDAWERQSYYLLFTSERASMVKGLSWGTPIYSLSFKGMDFRLFQWSVDSDSWSLVEDSYAVHSAIWPFQPRETNTIPHQFEMMYSNYNVDSLVDNSVYYFKTPAIKTLSYQWAISNFIQILCRVALVLIPVVFSLIVLFILVSQLRRVFHLYVKGVSLNEKL